MQIHLAKAQNSDLDFLIELRQSTMVPLFKEAGIKLSEQDYFLRAKAYLEYTYIIQSGDCRVGAIKYQTTVQNLKIIQFQIFPPFQNKGIGKNVLKEIVSIARQHNKAVVLKVLKNSLAEKMYKRFGFVYTDEDEHEFHLQYRP